MSKIIAVTFCLILLCSGNVFARGHNYHSSGRSSYSHSSGGSHRSVHVRSYTRKDGTVVRAHSRSVSGGAVHVRGYSRKSGAYVSTHSRSYPGSARDVNGHIKRRSSARHAFMERHPCPSTGRTSGACPGYVVDHVIALKHGGADDPANMQWQTKAAAKAKDKWE